MKNTLTIAFLAALAAGALFGTPAHAQAGKVICLGLPALTGDATSSAGSCATTVGKIGGVSVSLGGALATGGGVTFTGGFGFTGTLTGTTGVTFPTSGTLATTAAIPSLPLSVANGGTGTGTAGVTALNNITGQSYSGFTGTGNNVGSANPTLSGTVGGALTFSGALTLSSAITYGGVTLSNAVTGTGNMVLSSNATLVAPALGTPASGVLTNATGLPIASGVSGLAAGVATFLATPSSANLAAAITDETGSGALVFAASPTLTGTLGAAAATFTGQVLNNQTSTVASATGAALDDVKVTAETSTVTGTTLITRLAKVGLYQPTITDSSSVTVTDAATLYIDNAPAQAGSATITNKWALLVGAGASKLQATTLGGALTYGGVTLSNAVTGTGNMVLASSPSIASPTFTGTVAGAGTIPLSILATQAADTVNMNATGGSASPTAVAMPTSGTNGCAGASNALQYNTTTHALGCGTISGGTATIINPQGRLTLQSGHPIQTADQNTKSTVFYDSFSGNQVPIYNGSSWSLMTIGSDEISLGLNATLLNGAVYDIYAFNNAGTLAVCYGPKWASSGLARLAASAINRQNGIWTNTNAFSSTCIGGATGTTTFSISANQGTYLGTIYTSSTGNVSQTSNLANGPWLGLYNAYNQVPVSFNYTIATASWTYATATWNGIGGGGTGQYIDGLGNSPVYSAYSVSSQSSLTTVQCAIGVAINTSGTFVPANAVVTESPVAATGYTAMSVATTVYGALGVINVNPVEYASGATCTFEAPVEGTIKGAGFSGWVVM